MGIFTALLRKFRKTRKFRLNRLPYTLREQVFSNLEHQDRLKFLRISRELRHFILNHGTIPRKIKEIQFSGTNPRTIDGILSVEELKVIGFTERQEFSYEIEDLPETPQITRIAAQKTRAFRDLASCQKILIRFHYRNFNSNTRIDLEDFLPRSRFVDGFAIEAWNCEEIRPIITKFSARILSNFKLSTISQREIPSTTEYSRFFLENLADCAGIELIGVRLEMASVYRKDFRLQTTNLKRLEITSANETDFCSFTTSLLENHSDFPRIVIVRLDHCLFWSPFGQIGRHLIRKLENYEKIEDPTDQAKILKRFIENTSDAQTFFDESAFFRRKITDDSCILYLFLRNFAGICFQAHVVTIS